MTGFPLIIYARYTTGLENEKLTRDDTKEKVKPKGDQILKNLYNR